MSTAPLHGVSGLVQAFAFQDFNHSFVKPSVSLFIMSLGQPIIIGNIMAKVGVMLYLF